LGLEVFQIVKYVLLNRFQIGKNFFKGSIFFLERVKPVPQTGHAQLTISLGKRFLGGLLIVPYLTKYIVELFGQFFTIQVEFVPFLVGQRLILFLGIVATLFLGNDHQAGYGPLQGKTMLAGLLLQRLKQSVVGGLKLFKDFRSTGLILRAFQRLGDVFFEGIHQLLHIGGQLTPLPRRHRE